MILNSNPPSQCSLFQFGEDDHVLLFRRLQSSTYWYHGFCFEGAFAIGGKIMTSLFALTLACFVIINAFFPISMDVFLMYVFFYNICVHLTLEVGFNEKNVAIYR